MTEIIGIMIAGMAAGYILRHRTKIINLAERLTGWAIYLLLFLLGLSVGQNREVVSNFSKIGYHSVFLTFCAIGGSVILSYAVYIIFFRSNK